VRVRDGKTEDEPVLKVVFRRSVLWNEREREAMLAHPEVLEFSFPRDEGTTVRVALSEDGQMGGFSTLIVAEDFFELEDLFVDPDWMRRGFGTALIRDAIGLGSSYGLQRIEVTANPQAMAFYEHVGFVGGGDVETRFGPALRMHLGID
jgi:GNAT superfamily N-acetyltransferase